MNTIHMFISLAHGPMAASQPQVAACHLVIDLHRPVVALEANAGHLQFLQPGSARIG